MAHSGLAVKQLYSLLALKTCTRSWSCSTSPSIRRSFSSTLQRRVKEAEELSSEDAKAQVGKRPSPRTGQKRMSASEMGDDMGLLPETLVRPKTQNLPPLFSNRWKRRLWLEWHFLQQKARDFFSIVFLIYWQQRKQPKSKRPRLDLSSREAIALDLHKIFYTALAAGSMPALRPIACDGLRKHAQSQILRMQEKPMPAQSWTRNQIKLRTSFWPLTKLLPFSPARVVSDRAAPLEFDGSFWRQCIVRIRSTQWINRKKGSFDPGSPLTEYVVIQQTKVREDVMEEEETEGETGGHAAQPRGKQDSQTHRWKMWGTILPPTKAEVDALVADDAAEPKSPDAILARLRRRN